MTRWTCPACDREFQRAHQSHLCVPGCTVEECFAGYPPAWRDISDLLVDHVRTLGPVHVDVVGVGVFLKSERKLAEIRPKARSLSLALILPRIVEDPRIIRAVRYAAERVVHFLKLTSTADVDGQLRTWLTEAYDFASA